MSCQGRRYTFTEKSHIPICLIRYRPQSSELIQSNSSFFRTILEGGEMQLSHSKVSSNRGPRGRFGGWGAGTARRVAIVSNGEEDR